MAARSRGGATARAVAIALVSVLLAASAALLQATEATAAPPPPLTNIACTDIAREGSSPAGADGTLEHPWPSLAAMAARLEPGDTGCLDPAGGPFRLSADTFIGSTGCDVRCVNGTPAVPITLASLPGGRRATIAWGSHRLVFTVDSHDWRIEGIDFTGRLAGQWPGLLLKGDRITVSRSTFSTARTGTCIEIGERSGAARRAARDVLVARSRLIGCGRPTGDTAAIHVEWSEAPGPQLRDNVIARSAGAGVLLFPHANSVTLQRNLLHANRTAVVLGGGRSAPSSGNVIRGNVAGFSTGIGRARGYNVALRFAGAAGTGNTMTGNCLLKGANRFDGAASIGPRPLRGMRAWGNLMLAPRWMRGGDRVSTPLPHLARNPANFTPGAAARASRCARFISAAAPLPFRPPGPLTGRVLRGPVSIDPIGDGGGGDGGGGGTDPEPDREPACTHHLRASGVDSTAVGAGSAAAPWRTLQYAAPRLAAGDVLCITGTIPAPSSGNVLTYRSGGTEAAPVTITSAPGQRATVNGRWDVQTQAHDLVVSKLTLRYAGPAATGWVLSGQRITLRGNDISGYATCIGVGWRDGSLTGRDVTIDGNRIHDCGREHVGSGSLPYQNQDHAIYVDSGLRTRILRNVIHHNASKGVLLVPDARATQVAYNVIDHNGSNVWFGDHNSGTYGAKGSRVHHNVLTMPHTRPVDGHGYNVGAWWADLQNRVAADNQVSSNCLFADAGSRNVNTDADSGGFTIGGSVLAAPGYASVAARDYTMPPNACRSVLSGAGGTIPFAPFS